MKIAVIGSGSWGTALALKGIEAGHRVTMYCRTEEKANYLREYRSNPYLPEVVLPLSLEFQHSYELTLKEADVVLMVTPSSYVRSTLQELKTYLQPSMVIVGCSKGLETDSEKRLSQVIEEEVQGLVKATAILSGPNHAEEVGRNLPAATVVASHNEEAICLLQQALGGPTFRVYGNTDVIGVELGGATKNVIALAAGIAHGMKLGDNLLAALLTRGLHEMTKFGVAMGAKAETYAGLSGMGDLIATCMSPHSRNRRAGQKLADGETMKDIINRSQMVVEGFFAVRIIYDLAKAKGIDMPITNALYDVLYNQVPPAEVLMQLMMRDVKQEVCNQS
jgi:glycerol-3-phosphate dehydrogenase [NAD(P)+]